MREKSTEALSRDKRLEVAMYLALSAAIFLFCACSLPSSSKTKTPIAASLNRSTAFNCEKLCSSIGTEITIKNNSNILYCISDDYNSRFEASYIELISKKDGHIEIATRSTGLLPSNVRGAGDNSYAEWLRKGSNHLVQPGESITMTSVMDGYFDIKKSDWIVKLKLFYYPCATAGSSRRGSGVVYMTSPLTINQ